MDGFSDDETLKRNLKNLLRWKQASLVLNSSRRFRYTFDLGGEPFNQVYQDSGSGEIDDRTQPNIGSSETRNPHHISVADHDNNGPHSTVNRGNSSDQMVTAERIFVIINFVMELPSAVFDQLSSVNKPRYALASAMMSFAVLLLCILELVYTGRKERVTWKRRGKIPWFYSSSPRNKRFGGLPEIVGLVCAVFQCIFTTIGYAFLSRHVDNPVKISVWPIIFSFGLLCSKFLKDS